MYSPGNKRRSGRKEDMVPKPLEGIRVLEWGIFHAGPGASAILGDLGAEVIKIEQPGMGDPIRMLTRFGKANVAIDGKSLFHEGANRHKKGIVLDLKAEKGREIAHRLVARSDVFVTNVRRKVVEGLGMGYPVLREINPGIVYAAVSGYGPRGPESQQGAFDFHGQARSGLMYCMGEPDMPPLVLHFGVVDQMTAIMASHAILTALLVRERTGQGQELHVSILGSAMYLQYFNVMNAMIMGQPVPRHQRSSTDALRNYYRCKDGEYVCLVGSYREGSWEELCHVLGRPEIATDPRFATREDRFANCEALIALLDEVFATRTRDEWHRLFVENGVFGTRVNSPMELKDDPQVMENDYLVSYDHPWFGSSLIPGYPAHFSDTPADTRGRAPVHGEHTDEVLRDMCGYSDAEINQLRDEGII
ncbi:MAG: CoA transferase [Chloroflexi bacterium]|nr:MAG: CoA transferase [Chloroflexota bacterium]